MTLTDEQYADLDSRVRQHGRESGQAAGTWTIDGNTSGDTARAILREIEDCDFEPPPPPSPFAGQWADDPRPIDVIDEAIARDAEYEATDLTDDELDELSLAWIDEWTGGYVEQVEADARSRLGLSM